MDLFPGVEVCPGLRGAAFEATFQKVELGVVGEELVGIESPTAGGPPAGGEAHLGGHGGVDHLIGLVGGLLPALRAARLPIAAALREL